MLLSPCASTQSPALLPPEVTLLARIKARVKEQMAHVPEYTCLETLDRYHKSAGKNVVEKPLDTVRLEVLFAGRQEFFASPGARDFRDSDPGRFISTGMIGSGMFAGHVQTIFVDDNALFDYASFRMEDFHGRRAARYAYRVPLMRSGYTIGVPGAQATVGIKGTFWADPETFNLIRLEVEADEIPPVLMTTAVFTAVDFAPMRIGEGERWLAQSGVMTMARENGDSSTDRFEFTHCRSYRAESSVSFDDSGSAPAAGATAPGKRSATAAAEQALPAGLLITVALTSPISEHSAVGDAVEGKVVGDVSARGAVVVRDGAAVHGRLRMLERPDGFEDYWVAGIEFEEVELAAGAARFFADLQSGSAAEGIEWKAPVRTAAYASKEAQMQVVEHVTLPNLPGVGTFFVHGDRFTTPAGLRMTWKTRAM